MGAREPVRFYVVSDSDAVAAEIEWTAGRADVALTMSTIKSAADARDVLTAQVRDGLPHLILIDLRQHAVAGIHLVRWIGSSSTVSRMLTLALVAAPTNSLMLHGLGADVVLTTLPDANKLRQLVGIARAIRDVPRTADREGRREALRLWRLEREKQRAKN